MSTYGQGGSTYGALFGGGVALYGAYGTSTSTDVSMATVRERTAGTLSEASVALIFERPRTAILIEMSDARVTERTVGTTYE